jgi:uncharacterized protein YjbI with pentapeptide repeats
LIPVLVVGLAAVFRFVDKHELERVGCRRESSRHAGTEYEFWDCNGKDLTGLDLSAYLNPTSVDDEAKHLGTTAKLELARDGKNRNFVHANFRYANLSGANLSGLNLYTAFFIHADLRGADLSNTVLTGTDFRWADLTGANLSGAYLRSTQFGNANLTSVDLSFSDVLDTSFGMEDFADQHLTDIADLTNMSLRGALVSADFRDIDLSSVDMTNTDFSLDIEYNEHTIWPSGINPPPTTSTTTTTTQPPAPSTSAPTGSGLVAVDLWPVVDDTTCVSRGTGVMNCLVGIGDYAGQSVNCLLYGVMGWRCIAYVPD